jgi:phosphoglucosamine mutase
VSLSFGTDGVRGRANAELTPEAVLALGRAAGRVLGSSGTASSGQGRFLVGRDTRRSGPMLEAALVAGLTSEGVDVDLLGIAPTPAVAWAAARSGSAAAVISASHNPWADNGVKVLAPGGRKLDEDTERTIEREWDRIRRGRSSERTSQTGVALAAPGTLDGYLDSVVASVGGHNLSGLTVVVDCANGAASVTAAAALARLGAAVTVIAADPDGSNINEDCGSTHPERLQEAVVHARADVGLALDGDADRVLAVAADGSLVDGDHLIALCAIDRHDRGVLVADTVAVTVMSNLGLRLALEQRGITVIETPVGDRHVVEALQQTGATLGGEQSGHIVFLDLATTGDGLLTGLQVLDIVRRAGRPLAELAAAAMTALPQVLRSVGVAGSPREVLGRVEPTLEAVREQLGATGRLVVRPSGTEPVVRVMAEAPERAAASDAVDRVVAALEASGEPTSAPR